MNKIRIKCELYVKLCSPSYIGHHSLLQRRESAQHIFIGAMGIGTQELNLYTLGINKLHLPKNCTLRFTKEGELRSVTSSP